MSHHLDDLPSWARELLAAQAETITLQSQTLNRIAVAMSAQSDATKAALKALTDEAHVAAGVIVAQRADLAAKDATIADLQSQPSAAQGAAEDAAGLKEMEDGANAAAGELHDAMNPPAPEPEPQPEPQPEPAPEPAPEPQPEG